MENSYIERKKGLSGQDKAKQKQSNEKRRLTRLVAKMGSSCKAENAKNWDRRSVLDQLILTTSTFG